MKVLVIAPHTDDGELGCGATISRLIREGHEVSYMCFSSCGKDELILEMLKSLEVLGIRDILMSETPVRNFHIRRQDILDFMVNRNFDLVFTPSSDDIHQDHRIVNEESKRAFKRVKLLGYELPWNSQGFAGNCFFNITKDDLEAKIKALAHYKTQKQRNYFNNGFIDSLATVRGVQAGYEFAECFEVIRWYE